MNETNVNIALNRLSDTKNPELNLLDYSAFNLSKRQITALKQRLKPFLQSKLTIQQERSNKKK